MIELENLENLESGLISSKLTKRSHLGSFTAKSHKSGARQDLPIPACRARRRREVADAMSCDVRYEILSRACVNSHKGILSGNTSFRTSRCSGSRVAWVLLTSHYGTRGLITGKGRASLLRYSSWDWDGLKDVPLLPQLRCLLP